MEKSKCRSCGAAIIWCVTESGKRMSLDAEPGEGGTFRLEGGVAVYVGRGGGDLFAQRYRSHFGTCPNAAAHRKK